MIKRIGKGPEAPISERETLLAGFSALEASFSVLVSTCDRVELYAEDGLPPHGVDPESARNLFRLCVGLESPMLGESAVLGQVKEAYKRSCEAGKASPLLHRLFQAALRAGKRVRTATGISRGAMSHAQAAVELMRSRGVELAKARIAVIGVNRLNRSVLRFLANRGASTVFLASRSFDKARAEAECFRCFAFPLSEWPEILKQTDILVSATSAPHLIIRREYFPLGRKMLIVDLAVPRDVDPAIREFPGVELYDVSDVERLVTESLEGRRETALKAEEMVEEELQKFFAEEGRRLNPAPRPIPRFRTGTGK
jgi:glutamyl-tRNA reductase